MKILLQRRGIIGLVRKSSQVFIREGSLSGFLRKNDSMIRGSHIER